MQTSETTDGYFLVVNKNTKKKKAAGDEPAAGMQTPTTKLA